MEGTLLLIAAILFACVAANRFSDKLGMPVLIIFMALGMLFGSDGLFKIYFENYYATEQICTVALIFIMFYGGFGTKWEMAKPVAVKAVLLSTVGVVITALLTCGFCYFVLNMKLMESFLIGAVISSTDAASVFSILRSKSLSLKDGTASLLELESGSNDPMAYMLTMIGLVFIQGSETSSIGYMLFAQICYGALIGVGVALAGIWILQKTPVVSEGLDTIFILALILASYGLPLVIGGNGYLSVYITGIILGNSKISNKAVMVHFFDGITSLAQILIFFLLGLLSFPHKLPTVFLPAALIALFLLIVARPAAIFLLLKPFKCSAKQCLLVSWAGLRGAASIVFAIMVMASGVRLENDMFHIVFFVSLLSVALQGSLLPFMAKKLDMVDETSDVRKTFNDYQEESAITLMRFFIPHGHNWENKKISEVHMPTGSLALMIKRGSETLVPRGETMILANDNLILSVPSYSGEADVNLEEILINKNHAWCNKSIEELKLPEDVLIAMVRRGDKSIIPSGQTVIKENDVIVMCN